jgi:hypothetical protein
MRRCLLLVCALWLGGGVARAAPEPAQKASFEVEVDVAAGRVSAKGTLAVRNRGAQPLRRIPLVVYAARFRTLDPEISDITFDRYYARWFRRGDGRLISARDASGGKLKVSPAHAKPKMPAGTAWWVELPAPLAPGAWTTLHLQSVIDVPRRLGGFGLYAERLVLDGGLLPYVPEAGFRSPPARTRFDLRVRATSGRPLLVVGPHRLEGRGRAQWTGFAPSLVAGGQAPLLEQDPDAATPGIVVLGSEEDEHKTRRLAIVARQAADALARHLPDDAPQGQVMFMEAPLRDRLTQVCDGVILYSDRLFRVFPLLEAFHELELGRAVIQSLVRQRLAEVELGADRDWVCEGLAWLVAREWGSGRGGLKGRQIRGALDALSFIPAIDRLLRAPRFAGSDLFYGTFYEGQDAVPDAFPRALSRRRRGRVAAEKLREKLGNTALWRLVHVALGREPPPEGGQRGAFRALSAQALGLKNLDAFFALWLEGGGLRVPRQDLILERVETVRELDGGGRELRVTIRRVGDPRIREVGEPVSVAAVGSNGRTTITTWDGSGPQGEILLTHHGGWFAPLELDPEGRVHQTQGGQDIHPQVPVKILLNRLRVKVDLNRGNRNEAAVGTTIIPFHNYSHRIVLDGFYEQDERGLVLGYGYGFGWAIDQRTFGLGIGGEVTGARLDQGVLRDEALLLETEGDLISVGIGTSVDTRIFRDDPSWGASAGFHYEVSDKTLAGDFRFHRFDASITLLYSVIRGTTLGLDVNVGQIVGGLVPSQRLFDAGGEQAVRGVRTSAFVDRALIAVRGELRQFLWTDLDLNLMWLFYLRRVQVVLFLDAGDVGPDLDAVFRARTDWKWGTGAGIRLWAATFGVTRFILRFDVGFRIDDTSDKGPEYYVGIGQSF